MADEKRSNEVILDEMLQWVNDVYMDDDQATIEIPVHFKELMDEYNQNQLHPLTPYDFICVLLRTRRILALKFRHLLTWLEYDAKLTPEQMTAFKEFLTNLNNRVTGK